MATGSRWPPSALTKMPDEPGERRRSRGARRTSDAERRAGEEVEGGGDRRQRERREPAARARREGLEEHDEGAGRGERDLRERSAASSAGPKVIMARRAGSGTGSARAGPPARRSVFSRTSARIASTVGARRLRQVVGPHADPDHRDDEHGGGDELGRADVRQLPVLLVHERVPEDALDEREHVDGREDDAGRREHGPPAVGRGPRPEQDQELARRSRSSREGRSRRASRRGRAPS